MTALPPSLAVVPNIPWRAQSIALLEAKRDYWHDCVNTASNHASAYVAWAFYRTCCKELKWRKN